MKVALTLAIGATILVSVIDFGGAIVLAIPLGLLLAAECRRRQCG